MELDTNPPFDWAEDAFVALNHVDLMEKWPGYSNHSQTFPPSTFTLPPLISQASIERYGQITPPDDLSPAAPHEAAREGSIPVERLHNEVPWPVEQQIRGLANYDPSSPQPQPDIQSQSQSQPQDSPARASKRRRTSSKPTPANQSSGDSAPTQPQHQTTASANPQPPKRKRGRPKSQPQIVEAYTADGFPFQVSSARQSHLEKNRVAAHKCRQRKKDYINGLEARGREFSTRNKALKENVALLREEVLELKNEVLRHAGCGFWAVDEYLARCAGDLLGMGAPALPSRPPSQTQAPTLASLNKPKEERHVSTESIPSLAMTESQDEDDDDDDDDDDDEFDGLDMLKDFDEEMGNSDG